MQTYQTLVVKPGERFFIQVSGPNPSCADPTGLIGGAEHQFVVEGLELKKVHAYKTVFVPDPTNPHLERVEL